MKKPDKTIYKNQEEIYSQIIKKIKPLLKDVKEAYLIGSLVNKKFGRYDEEYEGYNGSDVDIVAIPKKILSSWKYEGEFYSWHKLYIIGEIKIEDTTHPINFMVPLNNNIELFWNNVKKLNWKYQKLQ